MPFSNRLGGSSSLAVAAKTLPRQREGPLRQVLALPFDVDGPLARYNPNASDVAVDRLRGG